MIQGLKISNYKSLLFSMNIVRSHGQVNIAKLIMMLAVIYKSPMRKMDFEMSLFSIT